MESSPGATPDTGATTGKCGGGASNLMRMSSRTPSWRERENNKRRERRRRAIAAKIFAGLRTHGNYSLPKHCDNNEVLKALCREAGWTVEADGTTYRQGCRPAMEPMDLVGAISASQSPCSSSQHQSPCVSSFNPSPTSSSPYTSKSNNVTNLDGASLIPWLKNLSSSQSPYINFQTGGSISAPVTPPISSPTNRTYPSQQLILGSGRYPTLLNSSSTPPSPGDQSSIPVSQWFSGIQQVINSSQGPSPSPSQPTSPTFSLISANPFGVRDLRPMSNVAARGDMSTACDHMNEFVFGGGAIGSNGLVKAWAGEEIVVHEDMGSDDLELTLGGGGTSSSRAR